MLNNTGFRKEMYGNRHQILFAIDHQVSMSIVVDQSAGVAQADGKKIVKAGTPLTGNLDDRTTPFTKSSTDSTSKTNNAVGILLHDVDVTVADNNGTLLIFGFVNQNRIDTETQKLLTAEVAAALPMIKIVKC